MVSGYNTLTLYVSDIGGEEYEPQPHISITYFNELIKNGKPCLAQIIIEAGITVSTMLSSITNVSASDIIPNSLTGTIATANAFLSVSVKDDVVVVYSTSN